MPISTATDSKAIAIRALKGSCLHFLQDLEAIPGEAFERDFGGVTRTVSDIAYEVNLVNDHIGMTIRGEEPFPWPDHKWIKAPSDFHGKEKVIAAFQDSSDKIVATLEGFSPEEFEATFQTEDGETTRYERCRFMTLHLWYHSGQLNFVQTLLGDDGWHWQ